LTAVSENERKIDNLRVDHELYGCKLHDLQMEDDEDNNTTSKRSGQPFSPEIEKLD
jgi:hypothetical protein